jgi:hypothetical protein
VKSIRKTRKIKPRYCKRASCRANLLKKSEGKFFPGAFQFVEYLGSGGYKEMSSILADQWTPSYVSPNAEEAGVAGSQPMRTAGAQLNFVDLTPYITYV